MCAGAWSEGAREACKNARLRPDSTRELGRRVCAGWGLGGRAESVQDVRLRTDSTREVWLRPVWGPECPKYYNSQCVCTFLLPFCFELCFYSILWGRRVCAGGWSEGAREACKSARLRPDSTREICRRVCAGWGLGGRAESVHDVCLRPDSTREVWSEGVCGLGARRSRGKRAGCALEAGFHPGGGVEAG